MEELTQEQQTAQAEFRQISDVLAVPTLGNPLPGPRKWGLPHPDSKAFADHPGPPKPVDEKNVGAQLSATISEDSKTGEPSVKDSPKQTGRK